jgi:hypothetical protein
MGFRRACARQAENIFGPGHALRKLNGVCDVGRSIAPIKP